MTKRRSLCLLSVLLLASVAAATINLTTTAVWQSTDQPGGAYPISTGCDWADVDADGDIDLAVANGNDITPGYCCVYFNLPGGLETTPSWSGNPDEYHGHLECADYDDDGYPELAAALLGGGNPWSYEHDVLYGNDAGNFSADPVWQADPADNSFGICWGDYDGDGDLDLAVACGVDYVSRNEPLRIYENQNGALTTSPAWESDKDTTWMDVLFADFDNDGYLDLAAAAEGDSNAIFFGGASGLPTTPGWEDSDTWDSIRLAAGDINGDGWTDLVVANNNQSAGQQDITYLSNGGLIDTTPDWQSDSEEMSSFAALADTNQNGLLDLAIGGWWQPIRIYENKGGYYNTTPDWTSQLGYSPVTEALLFGDYDDDGLRTSTDTFTGDGAAQVFQLDVLPIRRVDELRVGGSPLDSDQWCLMRQEGLVSLATAPGSGISVEVDYTWSDDLDLAQTDWLSSRPNLIFENQGNAGANELLLTARFEHDGVRLVWSSSVNGAVQLYRQGVVADAVPTGHLGRHAAAYTRALSLGDAGGRTGGDWQRLNDVPLPLSGAYLDRDETPDVRYLVEVVTPDGRRLRGEPVEPIGEPDAPARNVALSDPWPSPAATTAVCAVTLDSPSVVGLALYDLAGRRISTIFQGELAAGRHELTIDTTTLTNGVYLLRLDSSGESVLRRLAVVR